MKCSDVYLYESSLQPDQFGSLPKLQVSPKSLSASPPMMTITMIVIRTKMEMKKFSAKPVNFDRTFWELAGQLDPTVFGATAAHNGARADQKYDRPNVFGGT